MEMEDHHHHHHHHQHHQHHFGTTMNDLRQVLINNGPGPRSHNTFPSSSSLPPHPTAELFPGHHHRNLTQQHFEVMMFGRDIMPPGLHDFAAASTTHDSAVPTSTLPTPPVTSCGGFDAEGAGCIGGDPSTGRWPRQETLTLLEIRSRLDPKFKEANHKGPLWDEVSRMMCEEHGYQRSGKKCREKFENLYKYYKKTKEGKAGRHDGKHYRFFRQLEALYGENSNTVSVPETNAAVGTIHHFQDKSHYNNNNKNCDSLSLTTSTNFDTSTSDNDDDDDNINNESSMNQKMRRKRKSSGRSWKVKIKDFIDSQMRKLVEKQKEWLDKLVKTLEEKEKERMVREEEWRNQEAKRLEREQKFWAKERAWIEARDSALMEALHKLTGREILKPETDNNNNNNVMAAEVVQNQNNEDGSDEILNMCKEKWKSISDNNKKSKDENSRICSFYFKNNNEDHYQQYQGSGYCDDDDDVNDQGKEINIDERRRLQTNNNNGSSSSPSKSNNVGNVVVAAPSSDSCFPFLMSAHESGNMWENYGLKLNKENQN